MSATTERTGPGALVISLDFELHWGVRDQVRLDESERARLMAQERAQPKFA